MALDGDEVDDGDDRDMFCMPPTLWVNGVWIPQKAAKDAFCPSESTSITARPVAVVPVGLLEIKWMGLWPSSAMLVVVVVAWFVVAAVARILLELRLDPTEGCETFMLSIQNPLP